MPGLCGRAVNEIFTLHIQVSVRLADVVINTIRTPNPSGGSMEDVILAYVLKALYFGTACLAVGALCLALGVFLRRNFKDQTVNEL